MLVVSDAADCAAVVRGQLGRLLAEWGCDSDLASDAKSVATELVTNAMLHGGGCTSMAVVLHGRSLRIEVADRAGLPPQQHHYHDNAATGRGLGLVKALGAAWGWEPQAAGKIVWAEFGSGRGVATGDAGPVLERSPKGTGDDDRLVSFGGVNVADCLALQEQNDAVLRDVDLLLIGWAEGLTSAVPEDLLRHVQELRNRFGRPRSRHREAVDAAAAEGRVTVDLDEWASASSIQSSYEYVKLLEQIEAYAGHGHLLVSRPTETIASLRRWFVDRVAEQVTGAPCTWL